MSVNRRSETASGHFSLDRRSATGRFESRQSRLASELRESDEGNRQSLSDCHWPVNYDVQRQAGRPAVMA